MATSKKKTTAKKKAAPTKSMPKAAAKKSSRGGDPGAHVSQMEAGWFYMYQNNLEVGQAVVVGTAPNTTEYWFLYVSGYGTGQGAYTWPGPNHTPVITKYTYSGVLPPNWTSPSKYQSNLYPIVSQLVTSVCTASAEKKRK